MIVFPTVHYTKSVSHGTPHMEFNEKLIWWSEQLGIQSFVRFISRDSVACRIMDAEFNEKLIWWSEQLGIKSFATFISTGSVACRIMIPEFHERLIWWSEELGIQTFFTQREVLLRDW